MALKIFLATLLSLTGVSVAEADGVSMDHLAQFCSAQGAFGQQFGSVLPLAGRQIGTDEDVAQAKQAWVVIAREDFVEAPPEWAPISKVSVQRMTKSRRIFRIYGNGELSSHARAAAAAQDLANAMLAHGLNGHWTDEAFSFEQAGGKSVPDFEGVLYADENRLEISCAVPALVDEAMK